MKNHIRIVTASDNTYFNCLLGLIGSIIRNHDQGSYSIAVYNLGLSPLNISILKRIPDIEIFEVEKVNPDIIKPLRKHEKGDERKVPGLYSWKPVAIKQELDKHERVLWMDAGSVATANLHEVWEHIINEDYLFTGIGPVYYQTPITLKARLGIGDEIMGKQALNASVMGVSIYIYYDIIIPMYEFCKDISLFVDDGTAQGGPTLGRHDQTLFSILVNQAGLTIQSDSRNIILNIDGGSVNRSIVASRGDIDAKTVIYQCRQDADWNSDVAHIKKMYGI